MLFHNVKPEDIEILKGIFAFLTPDGWCIPEWIHTLERSNNNV